MFAAHPVHTEAVSGVVGRADILACLFFLLSFISYRRYCMYRDGNSHLFPADGVVVYPDTLWRCACFGSTAVCTTAAMLCKEQGVTVLAVCAVYDVFLHTQLRVRDALALYRVGPLK